jgi:hypothetical protein
MTDTADDREHEFESALAESQRRERAERHADIDRQQWADDRVVEALTQDT